MNRAYLILGGNMGHRAATLEAALELLQDKGVRILKSSALYETAPWQMGEQAGNFLNKVVLAETEKTPHALLECCLRTEQQLGRIRDTSEYSPRTIDIDILFFNAEIIDDGRLQVPHPRLHLRRFVLVPLAQLDAGFIHPVFGKSIAQLLDSCADDLAVVPYSGESGILK